MEIKIERLSLAAAAVTVSAALLGAGVWAMDTRYVTIGNLQKFAEEQDRKELQERIEELTLKKELDMASEYDKALLEKLKQRLNNR